jgi:hypothetical protein
MRKLRAAVAVVVAAGTAVALAGGGGASAAGQRQSGGVTFTSSEPGAATGTRFRFEFTNPENPDQKPHTITRFVVRSPAGTVFDFGAAPQCTASDAELQSQGAAACPADTKVGGGLAVSDTGSSGGFPPRYSESTITQFNGDNETIGVGENKDIPAIKTVTRSKANGTTSSTDFPTFPGTPPPDPYTPLKSLKVDFPPYVRSGRALVRTPRTCPSTGYWTTVTEFTYADGVTQSVASQSPCHAPSAGGGGEGKPKAGHGKRQHKKHSHRKKKKHHKKKHRRANTCRDPDHDGDCD